MELIRGSLSIELSKHGDISKLDYIVASHQDPDSVASLPRWLIHSRCKLVTSKLWSRFLLHLAPSFVTHRMNNGGIDERIIPLPDRGMKIKFGNSAIHAVPAHSLHSVANFHVYDPRSKILFCGDMGASMGCADESLPVSDFNAHIT